MDWTRPRPASDKPCKVRAILPDGRTFEETVYARSVYYAIFAFNTNRPADLLDIPRETRFIVTGPDGVRHERTFQRAWDWANGKG